MQRPSLQRAAGPHVILEVCWGPMAACKAVLAPGQVVRVGRGESADLRVPHDTYLADLHFELSGFFFLEGAQPDTLVTFTRGGIHSRRELLGA